MISPTNVHNVPSDEEVWLERRRFCIQTPRPHWHIRFSSEKGNSPLIPIACNQETFSYLKFIQSEFTSLDSSICESIIISEPRLSEWWNGLNAGPNTSINSKVAL